jgi:hypothetical protein
VQPFLAAAARAGAVSHPGLARVYDAASERRRGTTVTYLIREWVEGAPLDEHLRRVGELPGPDAADLLRQVADALTAAHSAGLAHGRVHPRNVLVTEDGRVRLSDAAVGSAVHGAPLPEPLDEAAVRRDTRDAAAVLYALLTGHWPGAVTLLPSGSLPNAPLAGGRVLGPHQLRAAVSRQLDHVVLRALDPTQVPALPRISTPTALADAADACVEDARRERLAASAPREPGWPRRHLGWLLAAGLVLLLGTLGWFAGLAVGALPRRPDAVDLLTPPTPSSGAARSAVPVPTFLDLREAAVRDFDPLGDQQENPDQVRNAVDGDPTDAWFTQTYRSPSFSGIKPGVGLLIDLGAVRAVSRVRVALTAPGAHLELHVADRAPSSLGDARLVASDTSGRQVATLTPAAATRARYVLIWITQLPKEGSGYRVGIAEVVVA